MPYSYQFIIENETREWRIGEAHRPRVQRDAELLSMRDNTTLHQPRGFSSPIHMKLQRGFFTQPETSLPLERMPSSESQARGSEVYPCSHMVVW